MCSDIFTRLLTNDIAGWSLLISVAALLTSLLSAIYGNRQANHAFQQRVLLQYEPLKELMDEVNQICNKIDASTTVVETEQLHRIFHDSIKGSELFLLPKVYRDFHALLDPFNEAVQEMRRFLEHPSGTVTPDGMMRTKDKLQTLEISIRNIRHSIGHKLWKM